jgi:hypothetical protein
MASMLHREHWHREPPVTPHGHTIQDLLERIPRHRNYCRLPQDKRDDLAYLSRFDLRRTREHNDYIRSVWEDLNGTASFVLVGGVECWS